jgi:RNA polymerase sigma-70 factor (ECF subfamily)
MADQEDRLSQIQTLWTNMFTTKRVEDVKTQDGPPRELVLRYYGAVYRYILGMVRDPEVAMELTQEFATRFLRGDFKKANPEKGRFRDFLKVSLRNLVMDHYRKQKVAREKGPVRLPEDSAEPGDDSEQKANDEAFVASFREEVLARTWEALAEVERSSSKPFHTVLRFKIQHPQMPGAEMAEVLSRQLGKAISDAAMRQTLHRARSQFADLLLDEVSRTLVTQDAEALTLELVELRLLDYCKSALDRRVKQTDGGAEA